MKYFRVAAGYHLLVHLGAMSTMLLSLFPHVAETLWFDVDPPYVQEQHQVWLQSIAGKGNHPVPTDKSASEHYVMTRRTKTMTSTVKRTQRMMRMDMQDMDEMNDYNQSSDDGEVDMQDNRQQTSG